MAKGYIVCGIDPGNTTGYAFLNVTGKFSGTILESGEIGDYPRGIKQLIRSIWDYAPHVVVIEDFVVRRSLMGSRLYTIRVIGAIECALPAELVSFQQPSEKQRVTDKMLMKYKLYRKTRGGHQNDAIRHCMIWAQKNYP